MVYVLVNKIVNDSNQNQCGQAKINDKIKSDFLLEFKEFNSSWEIRN